MKIKTRLLQLLWLGICACAFLICETGANGKLPHWLRPILHPIERLPHQWTDFKFAVRGPRPVQHPIVIAEIDEASIEALGRWPWRRDYMAFAIDKIFEKGARAVGLDVFFSERQEVIPDELKEELKKRNLSHLIQGTEYDGALEKTISKHRENLVLAWASESECRPAFSTAEYCPVSHPDALNSLPDYFDKFSLSGKVHLTPEQAQASPLSSVSTLIPNLERFEKQAKWNGFVNDYRDNDGLSRRTSLVTLVGGQPYPTLPLALVKLWKQDELSFVLDPQSHIQKLNWKSTQTPVGVNPLGIAQINFRGKERSFPYVSIKDILEENTSSASRSLASSSKTDILKGAIVLVGMTAIGLTKDVVATPFDATMPGVEVHANIIDNILSEDFLKNSQNSIFIISLLLFLALGIYSLRASGYLEGFTIVTVSLVLLAGIASVDVLWLFPSGYNPNWIYHYMGFAGAIGITVTAQYIHEERQRKFLRSAFSMYVAPAVVDSLAKDPSQLALGGRREKLAILFTDIRSFTTFAEKTDPQALSRFLNDYLGMQTEVIFNHGGTLDKYIGDAIMAFWGAPLALPNPALNACQSALSMMEVLEKHGERLKKTYGIPLKIGIGFCAGEVSVGNMGCSRSFNYTVIGDSVNLASRLEGVTKHLGVTALTTEETLKLAQSDLHKPIYSRKLLPIVVKGREEPVQLVELKTTPFEDKWIKDFGQARDLYFHRQFKDAEKLFNELKNLKGQAEPDGPCQVLAALSRNYLTMPPAADWKGEWELTEK